MFVKCVCFISFIHLVFETCFSPVKYSVSYTGDARAHAVLMWGIPYMQTDSRHCQANWSIFCKFSLRTYQHHCHILTRTNYVSSLPASLRVKLRGSDVCWARGEFHGLHNVALLLLLFRRVGWGGVILSPLGTLAIN
jgi:hypothetical protein